MEIDPDRELTSLQVRVLRVLRGCGPCRLSRVCDGLPRESRDAVRCSVWILRRGGWVARRLADPDETSAGERVNLYDITPAGRAALRDRAAAPAR